MGEWSVVIVVWNDDEADTAEGGTGTPHLERLKRIEYAYSDPPHPTWVVVPPCSDLTSWGRACEFAAATHVHNFAPDEFMEAMRTEQWALPGEAGFIWKGEQVSRYQMEYVGPLDETPE